MAFGDSKNVYFDITDTGGTVRNRSPYLTSVDGLPGTRELLDVTALGDSGRKFIPGLENSVVNLEGLYDDDTTGVGSHDVLQGLFKSASAVAIRYGPDGSTTAGKYRVTASVWVRDYNVMGRVGAVKSFRAALQVNGVVTLDVFT